MEESIQVTLKNSKNSPEHMRVVEHMHRWNNWKILKKSHDYINKTPQTVHFNITIPPKEKIFLTYSVKYTW